MKKLSYFFSISFLFSIFFVHANENLLDVQNNENVNDLTSQQSIVEEKLNSLTEEEKLILQTGFMAFSSILEENLKNSEEYLACANLLKEKGLDISFFVNLVPSQN